MRKFTFTLLLLVGVAMSALAQGSNYIFFAENGEPFYVIVNGIRQNEKAETNVMVGNVRSAMSKVRIIFADTTLGIVEKTLPTPMEPVEATFNIKRDKTGKFVARYMGEVPIAQAPPAPKERTVVVYNTTPMPPIQQTTVTTTTTTSTGLPGETINVNMNVDGFGFNMNVNDGTTHSHQTTYTETTTTTTTTTPVVHHTPTPEPTTPVYKLPGYNGPIGCPWPMDQSDFSSAKSSISSKSFEDTKLTLAKQIFDSNCLLSGQVKEVMGLFSFEDSKLEFAKYAYGRTYDLGNYYKVNDAFTYSSSVDDLNDYIQRNK